MKKQKLEPVFVVCVSDEGYRASLVVRRLYEVLPDPSAARRSLVRR